MLDSGWRVFEACGGGKIHEFFFTPHMISEKRNLFCFSSSDTRCQLEPIGDNYYHFSLENKEQTSFDYVEFLFNQRDDVYFQFSGTKNVRRSLSKSILYRDGVPFLSPEIVLLYKSTYIYDIDPEIHNHDFTISLPKLNLEQKQWLKKALEVAHPNNHEWLLRL